MPPIERPPRVLDTSGVGMREDMMGRILHDAEFLPFKLDLEQDRVLLVRIDAAQRADAAFLDERALPAGAEGYWLPMRDWLAAPPRAGGVLDWIFHVGHCGSTLLARLLQAWPQVQVLREPLPLRSLAAQWPDAPERMRPLLARCREDWSRTLGPVTRTVVKATSSCNVLAQEVLAGDGGARVLWLDLALEPWLATVLKSSDSIRDALVAAPQRARVLAGEDTALTTELASLEPHRRCAMGWLAERVRRDTLLAGTQGPRLMHVDFEALLAAPRDTLAALAAHLQLPPQGIDAALASPWWRRYAKAGQHAYGREDRDADLRLARQRFGPLLDDARAWLDGFLARHPRATSLA